MNTRKKIKLRDKVNRENLRVIQYKVSLHGAFRECLPAVSNIITLDIVQQFAPGPGNNKQSLALTERT
uniref:Uncharacterized protein n=1 Tax=Romanomermis culicivorax TaxID=13658 RepID=A0A915IV28_ROMCU